MTLISRLIAVAVPATLMSACVGSDDALTSAEGSGGGVSSAVVSALTVAGHYCPQHGEIAGRTIPSDDLFYLTTFGGGVDTGHMACGGTADGRGMYIADSWRFGCGAHVRLTNPRTGHWCVTQVADVGPNVCVEQAAGRPIIDASPVVARELYGTSGAGWSDRIPVRAELVGSSTPLGCGSGSSGGATPAPTPSPTPTPSTPIASCFSGTYGREMAGGTCLQSRFDDLWYQCTRNGWTPNTAIASSHRGPAGACTAYLPLH